MALVGRANPIQDATPQNVELNLPGSLPLLYGTSAYAEVDYSAGKPPNHTQTPNYSSFESIEEKL
jgi:hypothetical protein